MTGIQINQRRWLVLAMVWLMALTAIAVNAQGNPATELIPGETVDSRLDEDTAARVFRFAGRAGEIINIGANSDRLPLALILTDDRGTTVEQAADRNFSRAVSLQNITLPQSGTYFVTIFPAPGAIRPAEGDFSIVLRLGFIEETATPETESTDINTDAAQVTPAPTQNVASVSTSAPINGDAAIPTATAEPVTPDVATAEATQVIPPTVETPATPETPQLVNNIPQPSQILLSNGIDVRLQWNAAADMNLEVRDPVGNALRFNSRNTNNGGAFGFDANGLCEVISENPVETATWVPGFLPTGSYEILVFYRQWCDEETAAQPVSFTITVTVNGRELTPIQATLSPPLGNASSVYLSNFIINDFGDAIINQGGVYPDTSLNILPASVSDIVARSQPIQRGVPVQGALFEDQTYLAYTFNSNGNETVNINLEATSGSLDTLLQVIDPNGALLAVNDDANNSTNSSLPSVRLPNAGRYTIVATRYGKDLGGTEGNFSLELSEGVVTEIPAAVQALDLTPGDVQIVLTWNTTADLQLLVRDPLGDAVFDDTPEIASGGILQRNGNINCTGNTTGEPVSYIYWPFGFLRPGTYEIEMWYQNDCDNPTPVLFELTTLVNGAPVLVEQARPTENQRFVVSFTINNDGTAEAGPGGFIGGGSRLINYDGETPTPIVFGQTVTGSITQNNTFDVYSFSGTTGQVVTIQMAAISPALDTKLFLISPSGFEVAENDDADPLLVQGQAGGRTTDSLINAFSLPEDGVYRIIATRFASVYGGTVGNYALSVQQN